MNFGRLYGQGAAGLVASAREQYGLILDLATAKEWIRAFEETYPDFTRWCQDLRARLRAQRPHPDRARGRARPRDPLECGRVPLHPVPQSADPGCLRRRLHAGAGDDRRGLVRGGDRGRPGRGAARRDRAGSAASRCRAGRSLLKEAMTARLRGDLPRRAAAGPRRGEDRPVVGGDEVARRRVSRMRRRPVADVSVVADIAKTSATANHLKYKSKFGFVADVADKSTLRGGGDGSMGVRDRAPGHPFAGGRPYPSKHPRHPRHAII